MWQILDAIPGCELAILGCAYLVLWRIGVTAERVSIRYGRFLVGTGRSVARTVECVKVGSPHSGDRGVTMGWSGLAGVNDGLGVRI